MADTIYVGTRKGLIVLTKATSFVGWQQAALHFAGEPVTMVLSDKRDDTLYVALNLGHFGVKMQRSQDNGNSWQETTVPSYPEQPEAAKDQLPWSLSQIWCLEVGALATPGELWAGTIPGGLFHSLDGGDSWQLVRSLWDRPERENWFGGGYDAPGIHSICVDPRDSNCITAAVSCGGVWQSRDHGESWQLRCDGMVADYMPAERQTDPSIQDPHRLVQSVSNPDVMWVQHHNGIFLSTDFSANWQAISAKPSSFGFTVAVHPKNPDIAWFVPAVKDECRLPVDNKFVVTRTQNGGKSFETIDEGLPQGLAYDLVYRHGMDVDETGNQLVVGSTTGGLWLSDDMGSSWQCYSTNLPPIYCVRFG